METKSFYSLIPEVTSHHFCHILFLFVKTESTGLTDTQGEGVTQGHEYQEMEVMGAIVEAAYHKGLLSSFQRGKSWFREGKCDD